MGFKDLMGFFTRLPVKGVSFEDAADSSYLLPFVGLFIGVFIGLVGYLSFSFLSTWIAGIVTLISIYFATGILHVDGLSDFMDAVFSNASFEKAQEIMKDPNVGIGGVLSIFLLLLTGLVAFEALGSYSSLMVFKAAVVSEISAKLGISTVLAFGESPYKGSGDIFISSFNFNRFLFVFGVSLFLSLFLTLYFNSIYGLLVFTGFIVGLIFIRLGKHTIDGVNGDVMGGSNEVARITTLLIWGGLL